MFNADSLEGVEVYSGGVEQVHTTQNDGIAREAPINPRTHKKLRRTKAAETQTAFSSARIQFVAGSADVFGSGEM
ncbi:MAG: hypothetical protein NVS9B15_00140 [Acidobacteriaceae bacterium]